MKIQLSARFTYRNLLRFTVPSILMMLISQIYGIVDGLFVSNVVGSTAFAAMNLILPFIMSFSSIGFMLGTGGSALVAKTLGEGNPEEANRIFSMLIYLLIIFGIACAAVAFFFLKPIAELLGADKELLPFCLSYGRVVLLALPAFMLQTTFQTFLVVAERPDMGMKLSIASGITNVALDYVFMRVLHWGLAGAAAATALSMAVGAFIPFVYFLRKNKSPLRLAGFVWNGKALLQSSSNGASEMMTGISVSLVNMFYNVQLMKLVGVNGVSAYGVLMYAFMVFSSIFMGYSVGSAPLVSYNYGAQNHRELKNLLKKSHIIIAGSAAGMTLAAQVSAKVLARMFVGYDAELFSLTVRALKLFSISFLFCGFNMFASAFFTALNNGFISALISFLHTFVFQVAAILILPVFFGVDGIWSALAAAESLMLIISAGFYVAKNKEYGYF